MKRSIFTLMLPGILLFQACGGKAEKVTHNTAPVAVTLSSNDITTHGTFVSSSGTIEAQNSASISTRIMGYITKINVTVGQRVKKGQRLASISNNDLQAKKAQAEANVMQAAAAYNNAKRDYDRFTRLFEQQSASQKELDDMTSRYLVAKAGLEGAKQMRNEVDAQFSYTNIAAPFEGTITGTFAKEGDMASPGMPILSLEGNSGLQVATTLPESSISQISTGMRVQVMVKSLGKKYNGTVTEVSTSAKSTGGQYAIKINLITDDAALRSGMYVNVLFPLKNAQPELFQSVMVPAGALVQQGQLTGIYTVGTGNRAVLRWIRTGNTVDGKTEVLSGLSASERYIVSADGKLYNGALVSIK